jgi:hypothetical protein
VNIINEILGRDEFRDRPPILLDIGASGTGHREWTDIARHAICIAFDADDREMAYIVNEASRYKRLYMYNRIVVDKKDGEQIFYLTKSPFCSSLLEPDNERLNNYTFGELFEVEKKAKLETTDLATIFEELDIQSIDWFKTDSQGIDLRLFNSLGEQVIEKVLVADFEPGIIDAYKNEDKLHALMVYMDRHDFWMSDIKIQGSQRLHRDIADLKFNNLEKRLLPLLIKTSPGWGEVSYFNSFKDSGVLDKRAFLLGWVFAIIKRQYGFALELAVKGGRRFEDPIFKELERHALKLIKQGIVKLPFYVLKRIIAKIFGFFKIGAE